MIKKMLLLAAVFGGIIILSGCGNQANDLNQQNSVGGKSEKQSEAATVVDKDVFDCGNSRTCLVKNCKETKQCLYDLAANCSPAKGTVSYTWNTNSEIEVEHLIVGFKNGKCVYDGKIIAPGIANGPDGLSMHCELDNNLMQKIFIKRIFEQTILENCFGSYVDFLKKTAESGKNNS